MNMLITRRGHMLILVSCALAGAAGVIVVPDPVGTYLFTAITGALAWTFTLIYGLRATWRVSGPARAIFWLGLTYAIMATHVTAMSAFDFRTALAGNMRQAAYLLLALAMVNMILTTLRHLALSAARPLITLHK